MYSRLDVGGPAAGVAEGDKRSCVESDRGGGQLWL